jgi:hypothetical protein
VPDDEVGRAIGLLRQGAAHGIGPLADIDMKVEGADGHFVILDRGDPLATVESPRQVLDAVFERVHRRAFELASLLGWVRFHGAVLSVGRRRLALTGSSGSGKTTLAAATLMEGGEVESDESFLTRDGHVIAVPRRWHVRPATLDLLPEASWLNGAPVLDGDPPLRLVDPSEHGFNWPLPNGPVDAVVVLSGGGAGESVLARLDGTSVVRSLVNESFPLSESRAAVVRHASALAFRSPGYSLARGVSGPTQVIHTLAALRSAG